MRTNAGVTEVRGQQAHEWPHGEVISIDVPDGYIGPVLLSATGRTVWWTGRVAIGLRYQNVLLGAEARG